MSTDKGGDAPERSQAVQIPLKLSVSSVMGYSLGAFCKMMSQEIIFYSGIATGFIGCLAYMKWITINWKEIDDDITQIYTKARNKAQDTGFVARMKKMMFHVMPLMAGFSGAFYYGF